MIEAAMYVDLESKGWRYIINHGLHEVKGDGVGINLETELCTSVFCGRIACIEKYISENK